MGAAGSVLSKHDSSDEGSFGRIVNNTDLKTRPKKTPIDVSKHRNDINVPSFVVSLASSDGFRMASDIPKLFLLRINYESLDFVHEKSHKPIIQFPYQHIICWGSTIAIFKFNVFNYESGGTISISLGTKFGKSIEELTMATVRKLMVAMEKTAVSKAEFSMLIQQIMDGGELKGNWLTTIDQFSTGRQFLAKQCMDLMLLIAPLAPFEKLVVNTFEDREERENVIHRLGLSSSLEESKHFVSDCEVFNTKSLKSRLASSTSAVAVSSSPSSSFSSSESPTAPSSASNSVKSISGGLGLKFVKNAPPTPEPCTSGLGSPFSPHGYQFSPSSSSPSSSSRETRAICSNEIDLMSGDDVVGREPAESPHSLDVSRDDISNGIDLLSPLSRRVVVPHRSFDEVADEVQVDFDSDFG